MMERSESIYEVPDSESNAAIITNYKVTLLDLREISGPANEPGLLQNISSEIEDLKSNEGVCNSNDISLMFLQTEKSELVNKVSDSRSEEVMDNNNVTAAESSGSINEVVDFGSNGAMNNNITLQDHSQTSGSKSEGNSESNNTMSYSDDTQVIGFTTHTAQDSKKKTWSRKRFQRNSMYLALKDGNLPLVHLLLKQGASLNFTDRQGQFPAHLAAASGNIELLEILASWGGDLSRKDLFGYTPFHRAALAGRTEIIKWLYERGGGFTKETSWAGWTALHVAAMNGHYDTSLQLLQLGANVNAKDKDGWTPSYLAKLYNRTEVLKLLESWSG